MNNFLNLTLFNYCYELVSPHFFGLILNQTEIYIFYIGVLILFFQLSQQFFGDLPPIVNFFVHPSVVVLLNCALFYFLSTLVYCFIKLYLRHHKSCADFSGRTAF